ncbi:DUF3243 domain-containing protein [Vallitalea pronyensis]|uniref:DUF3243 domain-containing protein n=1 Tax=Vallitalea pronyensis TaxID=1348613 RepID=A0A8J8MNZ0_9FIRM|nr:DUF3243 domain-containing protein [Vallitalea pronyensis]QUI24708.1 DUF3243 domain-containing protein [Vallitalea pronyensis]
MELDIQAMNDYESWKKTLHTAVHTGKNLGMEDHTITSIATVVGDFLSNNVDPNSREHRVIKELWDQGTSEEKRVMANLIVKLVD